MLSYPQDERAEPLLVNAVRAAFTYHMALAGANYRQAGATVSIRLPARPMLQYECAMLEYCLPFSGHPPPQAAKSGVVQVHTHRPQAVPKRGLRQPPIVARVETFEKRSSHRRLLGRRLSFRRRRCARRCSHSGVPMYAECRVWHEHRHCAARPFLHKATQKGPTRRAERTRLSHRSMSLADLQRWRTGIMHSFLADSRL